LNNNNCRTEIFFVVESMPSRGGRGGRRRRWEEGTRSANNQQNIGYNNSNSNNRGYRSGGRGGRMRVEISKYVLEYQNQEQQNIKCGNTIPSDGKCDNHIEQNNVRTTTTVKTTKTTIENNNMSDEELNMMKIMGFCGFDSTKGKAIEDNQHGPAKGGARIEKGRRKYRQYMNRLGKNKMLDNDTVGSSINQII
jgi:hypothetical protein